MNLIRTLLLSGSAMAMLMTGCVRYLEEPTPAGRVPPAASAKAASPFSSSNAREQNNEVARQEQEPERPQSKAVESPVWFRRLQGTGS